MVAEMRESSRNLCLLMKGTHQRREMSKMGPGEKLKRTCPVEKSMSEYRENMPGIQFF